MNLIYGLALHEFSVAQVDRAPARCLGGHRFESCRGLRFFLCSTLVTWWLFHFHNSQLIIQAAQVSSFCSLCNIIMASFSVFSFLTGPLYLPPRLASRVLGLLCALLIDFCFSLFPHCGAWSQARWEAAWPSGQRFGLAISRCRVRVPSGHWLDLFSVVPNSHSRPRL